MHKIENPFEGILFHPASNKFSASLRRKVLGYFATLDEAIEARHAALRSARAY